MRTIALICLSLLASVIVANAAQLQDPENFPDGWKLERERSCVAKNGSALHQRSYSRDIGDNQFVEIFVFTEVNGVRKSQSFRLMDDGQMIGIRMEVMRGDSIVFFNDGTPAYHAAMTNALGMSREDYVACWEK